MTNANIFMKGQKAFLGGDLEDSIVAFSNALEHGVHPFHSLLNRGIAYLKTCKIDHAVKDFDLIISKGDAVEDFDAIISTAAIHEQAHFYRGIANLNLLKNEEAIQDLDKAIELNPERSASYLARGLAHHALGHHKEAEKNIHDTHVLKNVELGGFIEEYILTESLYYKIIKLFENDDAQWNLSLTRDEIERMASVH
jgi:tetratricopeptide (TPR) repeat protein